MFNNIYFVNASENNVSKLIENIKGVNEKEDYDIYILYTGNEAIEFSKKPLEIVQKSKIQKYKIIHPAARGKDMEVMQECWINFSYKEERYSKSEDILKKFRI